MHLLQFLRARRPLMFQFVWYVASGGAAAGIELLVFKMLLLLQVWYIIASPLSTIFGTVTAFLLQKYVVFQKRGMAVRHAFRYSILVLFNMGAQTAILYILVDFLGVEPVIGKAVGICSIVLWNFFLYKFVVYI